MRNSLILALPLLMPLACDAAQLIRSCKPTAQAEANVGKTSAVGQGFVAFGARGIGPSNTGAVYVYDGPGFARETVLQASDATPNSDFGVSVAADGSNLVVGAQRTEQGRGAVYVFKNHGDRFVEVAKLVADDRSPHDHFGWSCAIDGGVIVVGAIHSGRGGAAYVFENKSSGKWVQTAKLAPSSLPENAEFGISCDVSADSIIVGGRQLEGTGLACVFDRGPRGWSEGTMLNPEGLSAGDRYGHAVAISGSTAVVTAAWDDDAANDSGTVYVWQRAPSWRVLQRIKDPEPRKGGRFGYSIALDADTMIVGAPQYAEGGEKEVGLGLIYRSIRDRWVQADTIENPQPAVRDAFCLSCSVVGNLVAIGAEAPSAKDSSGTGWVFSLE